MSGYGAKMVRTADPTNRHCLARDGGWVGVGVVAAVMLVLGGGCDSDPVPYGRESAVELSLDRPQVWAVAPVINLSGQAGVDPLLQGDLCYQQLQQIKGLTAIPVDRVATVYAALGIDKVQSAEQAAVVCDLLGADALLVPTVTAWEPYNPPKMGGTLTLFPKPGTFVRQTDVDPRELVRRAAPAVGSPVPTGTGAAAGAYQSVGMYDASNGSVRASLAAYMYGRHDPLGPYGAGEGLVSSDKYAGFVYRKLTEGLLDQVFRRTLTESQRQAAEADAKKAGIPDGGAAGTQAFPSNRR